MCGYFVTSSRRRNHVCVPEGGPKSREGGTLSLCRETYFHLLHSPLCSQLSGCLLLLLLVLFLLLVCEQSCFYPTPVTAHNLLGLCWSDANNNLWLERWSTQCGSENPTYSLLVAFFFVFGGIAQLEVNAPSISWLALLS